jgi:acetyl esterase/lipase
MPGFRARSVPFQIIAAAGITGLVIAAAERARAAESPAPIVIWPNGAPGETGEIGPEREVPPKEGDTIKRITDVTKPTLTVFPAPPNRNTGAAVVIFPGGGYNILAWNLEGTEVAEWLNSIGVTAVILKYRVPARSKTERHAAPLQDAQRAVGIVRQRAAELGVKPDRIGVLGFSAGGHLAATLSTNHAARTYKPVDKADEVSCRPDFTLLVYPAYLVDKETNALSPEIKVASDTPRTFILHTEEDPVRVECSLFYYLALKNAKVPVEMHVYPTGGHGYGLRPSQHLVTKWPERAAAWLGSIGMLEAAK